jgi:hypothetical protein
MSKGYIVIAQNNKTVDYLEQAYALALNLKLTQSTVSNLTVCVDANTKALIKTKHKKVFDHIVDIPWNDDAENQPWKIHNKQFLIQPNCRCPMTLSRHDIQRELAYHKGE